ncbi:Tfp pilus assembly protein FimT/FimU [Thermodesulfobacteriota bacterium]
MLRKTAGFTMIEAIAVLLLLGILSTVIISSYGATESNTLVAEEATLKGHLRFAQLRAMNDQVSWGIALAANAYTLLSNGVPAPSDLPGEDSQTHSLPVGVSITLGAGTTVTFDQWGSPGPANRIITLSSGMDARAIPITRNTGFIP